MIDLAKNAAESSFVKSALKKFGLPTDLGAAIAALAYTIRDHKHLESILTGTSGEERHMLYESIKPHLRFTAKSLDAYVSSAAQRAEREQWPVLDASGNLTEFKPAQDVATVEKLMAAEVAKRTLTLTCSKCLKQDSFQQIGQETNVDVIRKARKAGWIHDYLANPAKEICPKCPTPLRPNA